MVQAVLSLLIPVVIALVAALPGWADEAWKHETPAEKTARLAWWTNDRFGMFVHFGLYAMPARVSEWVNTRERMTDAQYDVYRQRFNPDLFDARQWAKIARSTGMRYVVITAKHHDGFCLWDSKYTDFKITNTPFGRDLLREFVEACRAEGLKDIMVTGFFKVGSATWIATVL